MISYILTSVTLRTKCRRVTEGSEGCPRLKGHREGPMMCAMKSNYTNLLLGKLKADIPPLPEARVSRYPNCKESGAPYLSHSRPRTRDSCHPFAEAPQQPADFFLCFLLLLFLFYSKRPSPLYWI